MTTITERPFTAASFQAYLNEERLMGSVCPHCQAHFLPPRAICPHCYSDQLTWVEFGGQGKLAAYTAIYIAPSAMIAAGYGRDNPSLAGVVELEEGVKISGQILGEGVAVGTPLTALFVERGEGEAKRRYLAFQVA
jgi:uncharacterized protein